VLNNIKEPGSWPGFLFINKLGIFRTINTLTFDVNSVLASETITHLLPIQVRFDVII